ncbi:SDR family oxidoreductase [Persicimonas caeni]|uniref:SDR family oxidoreductase n=1 Tax=Persicimonas caeni TaxID=2292766 RepID=A0A4Y6PXK8_PERCE|nr:SDR family oxidoreductase [Persicimonas caeni]QDG53056.1 SDR family oxidoreductase [Persicimonas caeni]QED34278.1 SDR family oxidoreductase [Persicimonas caeni]
MNFHPKPLDEQVIVVTGASSGIGMTIAEMAAERGARVVLSARAEPKLRTITDRITERGLEATYVRANVTKPDQLELLAHTAIERYGGIDTWINNAGVTIFGRLEDTALDDAHQLFETNYWGVVNGSQAALPFLRRQGGGTLINIGSTLSDRSLALQGHYSASKHAVKAYTDALRMELEKNEDPIAVCLIKPASINTNYVKHAKNNMDVEPTLPPPVYAPEVVARAVLQCAEHPRRDVVVGGGARALSLMGKLAPGLGDRVMEATMFAGQKTDQPTNGGSLGTLYAPNNNEAPTRSGDIDESVPVFEHSLYTALSMHPVATAAAGLLLGVGAAALARRL